MVIVSPSILSADFTRIKQQLSEVKEAGADWIHIDVMDGNFVPNLTFGPMIVRQLRPLSDLVFDVHLMVEWPEKYIDEFISAGAEMLTIHPESTVHVQRVLASIKDAGVKAGMALNPSTSLDTVEWVIEDIDLLLIMSVNPGFGGQRFIPQTLRKIERAREMLDRHGSDAVLMVDGGVNAENAAAIIKAGADALVAGSFTFRANGGDIKKNISLLKNAVP